MMGVIDVLLGVISVVIIKLVDPNAVAIRSIADVVTGKKKVRFRADEFATAVIKRNKNVFDRLAEM